MAAGAVALLVALVLLWQSTRSESLPQVATPAASEGADPAAPATGSPASPAPATRAAPRASGVTVPGRRAPSPTTIEPSIEASPPPPAADNDQKLEFGSKQLHAQTRAVEPLVRECVDKAALVGTLPTGTAMLTYHVAKRGDKLAIENTGVDPETTTLQQTELLECLHQTANGMKFEGLPRDAQEIYAARRVVLENGKITEYKHVTFSYLR
jgi:hypothetical protein